MKVTLIFTAEVTEYFPDSKKITTSEEEQREILMECLREICSSKAEIIIHDFKLIERD